jgi:chromosome segregation ATPase
MSEQHPEWTVTKTGQVMCGDKCLVTAFNYEQAKSLVDAHQTALTAERKKVKLLVDALEWLGNQLSEKVREVHHLITGINDTLAKVKGAKMSEQEYRKSTAQFISEKSDEIRQPQKWTVMWAGADVWAIFEGSQLIGNASDKMEAESLAHCHNAALAAIKKDVTYHYALGAEEQRGEDLQEISTLKKQLTTLHTDYEMCSRTRDNHSKQLEAVLPIREKLEQELAAERNENKRLRHRLRLYEYDQPG